MRRDLGHRPLEAQRPSLPSVAARSSVERPKAGRPGAPGLVGPSIWVCCARRHPRSARCSSSTSASPTTPMSGWCSWGWWSCTWRSVAEPWPGWPAQLIRVRAVVGRRIRLTVSDLLLLAVTVNVLVSGFVDWGLGRPSGLPFPRPFSRWYLDSGLILVIYLTGAHLAREKAPAALDGPLAGTPSHVGHAGDGRRTCWAPAAPVIDQPASMRWLSRYLPLGLSAALRCNRPPWVRVWFRQLHTGPGGHLLRGTNPPGG